jgi:hypothetical protein
MPTVTPSDAVCAPQDPGTGTSSNDDPNSAALAALVGSHEQGSYVPSDGGLTFAVDTGANELTIAQGYCYIEDDLSSTTNQRGSGGRAQLQSAVDAGYDTELPSGTTQPYVVLLPSAVTVGFDSGTNDVFVSVDPTAQNSVTITTGNGISAPSDPSLKLGTADAGTGDTTRANDNPTATFASVSADDADINTLKAGGSLSGPTASEGDVVTVPDNPDVVPIYFDAQTGEPLYPDLEETA